MVQLGNNINSIDNECDGGGGADDCGGDVMIKMILVAEPPRAFTGPGAKLYQGPLRCHYFQTTKFKSRRTLLQSG